MTIRNKSVCVLICAVFAFSITPRCLGQENAGGKVALVEPAKAFRVTEGFQSPLSLKTKAGKTVTLKVGMHTWSIDSALGRQTIRTADFTLFHLRGGKIKVLIDGKEEMKTPDSYWTLPSGATLTMQVKGETALLDAMTVATR